MNKYRIWIEGYASTDGSMKASALIRKDKTVFFYGKNFKDACENALKELKWDMKYYNSNKNTFWGCHFFNNSRDARKSFG